MDIQSRARLNNGVEMPYFGLGTFLMNPGKETRDCVRWAIEAGYRMIDTAKYYENERDVGMGVKDSGISREELFVTTKLWNTDHGHDAALAAFEKSMEELGLGYIDLYLIHWPVREVRMDSWRALETLVDDERCRAIGVSNYTVDHLEELLKSSEVVPAVNQVEFHPYNYSREKGLMEFCRVHGIQLEGYSPLTRGHKLDSPELEKIASHYGKTTAQVLVRWGLQKEVVTIPKSSRKERILENADVFDFEISGEDMDSLDSIGEYYRVGWDPVNIP